MMVVQTWLLQTSTTNINLESVYFTDQFNGWAVGWYNTILHTTNGGTDWIFQSNYQQGILLKSIFFIDPMNGFAVGSTGVCLPAGYILRPQMAEVNWVGQLSNTNNELNSVYFVNQNEGWIVGYFGDIIKTTNKGDTWISQLSGIGTGFYDVHFVDNNLVWAVGRWGTFIRQRIVEKLGDFNQVVRMTGYFLCIFNEEKVGPLADLVLFYILLMVAV